MHHQLCVVAYTEDLLYLMILELEEKYEELLALMRSEGTDLSIVRETLQKVHTDALNNQIFNVSRKYAPPW